MECKTVKEAIDRPNITMLKKAVDPTVIEIYVSAQLKKVLDWINVDARLTLSETQIPMIAEMLIEQYPVETLEDIALCLKRGSIGMYGQVFRIDAAVINDWMSKYLDEKYQIIQSDYERSKNTQQHEFKDLSPFANEVLNGLKKKFNPIWTPDPELAKRHKQMREWFMECYDNDGNPLDNWRSFEDWQKEIKTEDSK